MPVTRPSMLGYACLVVLAAILDAPIMAVPPETGTRKQAAALDCNGDPLPAGAIARLGTSRFRHGNTINALSISPDGKRIVTSDHTPCICIWDAADGKLLRMIKSDQINGRGVAFRVDGKPIAVSTEGDSMRLVDLDANKPLWQVNAGSRYPQCLTISTQAGLFAMDGNRRQGEIEFWDLNTGKKRHEAKGHNGPVRALTFRADGKQLASAGGDGTIVIWDTANGAEIRRMKEPGTVGAVAYSRDGAMLASAHEKKIQLWDAATGKPGLKLEGHGKEILCFAFAPDGKTLASGSADKSIRLWDVTTGKERGRFDGHLSSVNAMALSPDGETLFAVSGHVVRSWNVRTGKERLKVDGHEAEVYGVSFSPDGATLVSGSADLGANVWDVNSGKLRQRFGGLEDYIFSVAVAPDGKSVATGGGRPFVRLRDLTTGKEPAQFKGIHAYVFCVAFSPDGKWLAAGEREKTIHIFDTATGNEVTRLRGNEKEIYALAFSPDGRSLASGGDAHSIHLWDIGSSDSPRLLNEQQDRIHGLAFSSDGRMLASTGDNYVVQVWETSSGQLRLQLTGHKANVYRLAFSPNGRWLATASADGTARIWDVDTGQERTRLQGHTGHVYSVAFGPHGRTLATGSADTSILVWDITAIAADNRVRRALSESELEAAWKGLMDVDAAKAYQAMIQLSSDPRGSVRMLKDRLRPATTLDQSRVNQLLADLSDAKFSVRERATRELALLEDRALPALAAYLKSTASAEARRRIERLISGLRKAPPPGVVQVLRAVEALEMVGTAEAQQVLRILSGGEPAARQTYDAQQALKRIGNGR